MEWFQETLHPAIRQTLKVDEVLHREQTALQDLNCIVSSQGQRRDKQEEEINNILKSFQV